MGSPVKRLLLPDMNSSFLIRLKRIIIKTNAIDKAMCDGDFVISLKSHPMENSRFILLVFMLLVMYDRTAICTLVL